MRRDPDVRRLLWSAAFFLAALGGLALLSRVGLFH